MSDQAFHDIDSLLGAYALDAVEPHERDLVDAWLLDHPEGRDEVRGHLEVAALLAYAGSPAPDRLWDRIAESLDDRPPVMRLGVVPAAADAVPRMVPAPDATASPPAPTAPVAPVTDLSSRRRRWTMAAAGVAAALVLVLGLQVVEQRDRIDHLEEEMATTDLEDQALAAFADDDNELVPLESEETGLRARAVLLDDGTAFIDANGLPALDRDRTYQLWGVTDGDVVVSLGVLGPEPGVEPFTLDDRIVTFAVTEEVAGGVVASENPALVVGTRA